MEVRDIHDAARKDTAGDYRVRVVGVHRGGYGDKQRGLSKPYVHPFHECRGPLVGVYLCGLRGAAGSGDYLVDDSSRDEKGYAVAVS